MAQILNVVNYEWIYLDEIGIRPFALNKEVETQTEPTHSFLSVWTRLIHPKIIILFKTSHLIQNLLFDVEMTSVKNLFISSLKQDYNFHTIISQFIRPFFFFFKCAFNTEWESKWLFYTV